MASSGEDARVCSQSGAHRQRPAPWHERFPLISPALHLSHATTAAADGGIATMVAELSDAQQRAGLAVAWETAAPLPSWRRDRLLLNSVRRRQPGLVHIHGLWRSPTRIAPQLAAAGLPLVITPHGMLDPWAMANSRWKKRIVWRLWEQRALAAAGCLQALCPPEVDAIRALGFNGPVALIPNGVRLPQPDRPLPPPPWAGRLPEGEKVLLFLGRFHAKKGLVPLLQAWSQLSEAAGAAGWWLVLVGHGDDGALQARVQRERLQRLLVLGPCFGAEKEACLAAADAFVLPSFSEGLPMAVLEAMSWGLPCLLTEACNLPEAFTAGAALLVTPTSAGLQQGLQALMAMSEPERRGIGAAGSQLVRQRFGWAEVAEATGAVYRWLLGEAPRPDSLL
jgi:glycosyltransferase involved in cell wall biosynthesis